MSQCQCQCKLGCEACLRIERVNMGMPSEPMYQFVVKNKNDEIVFETPYRTIARQWVRAPR